MTLTFPSTFVFTFRCNRLTEQTTFVWPHTGRSKDKARSSGFLVQMAQPPRTRSGAWLWHDAIPRLQATYQTAQSCQILPSMGSRVRRGRALSWAEGTWVPGSGLPLTSL